MKTNKVTEYYKTNKGKTMMIIAILTIGLISTGAIYAQAQSEKAELIVQGSLHMEETSLNSKIPGTIDQVLVSEGDYVKEGDPLVIISSETIEAKLKQAESAKQAAEAQAGKAGAGARTQEVAQAKAGYDYAQKTYDRMKILKEQEAISEATFDQVEAQYIAAKETYNMALEGARSEDKVAANALVGQADGAVLEVNSYLDDSVIKSPVDGIVSGVNVSKGELVSTGMPVASIISKAEPWVLVNVKETELSNVNLGQIVNLEIPAYPGETFKGKVINVSQKPDFATKRATNENGDFDILSYGVKIKLIEVEKNLYQNMTVLVNFQENKDN